jgi:predicted transcriptional regulator
MSNAQRFLALFNDIENHFSNLAAVTKHQDFMVLVARLSESHRAVKLFKNDLREYSELRNAIVHQTKGKPIAEPYDETVADLKRIIDFIKKPPTAYEIASKPVYKCSSGDLISSVVKKMTEQVYTHIPVLHDGKFIGVFSESSIIRWLGSSTDKDGFLLDLTKIGQIKEHFDKENDTFCGFKFVSRRKDAFSIKDEFLSFVEQTKRLGAIFVTENGKKEEDILGIVTSWDLPKINQ